MARSSKPFGLLWVLVLSTTLVASETVKDFPGTSSCYMKYKADPAIRTKTEKIKFDFRTTEASGLILYAGNINDNEDFLVVELVGGMIRYFARFGANSDLDQSSFEIFVGQNLAENEWHSVVIERQNKEVKVYIDPGNHDKEAIGSATLSSFMQLSVDNFHIGGLPSGSSSLRGAGKRVVSVPNYKGCIKNLQFDSGLNVYKLLESEAVNVGGCVSSTCKRITYKPFTFTDEDSYLKISAKKNDQFSGFLSFRTYSPYGILVEQKVNGGSSIKVSFTQDNVRLDIFQANSPSASVHVPWKSGQLVDDGTWHKIEFKVTKTSLTISADGSKKEQGFQTAVEFTEVAFIGESFVGCMKDLSIDGNMLNVGNLIADNRKRVIVDKCQSYDLCHPNPCLNNGKCSQLNGKFQCDCSGSPYGGTVCQFASNPRSCEEKKKEDPNASSGKHIIDPDNSGPLPPMEVQCNMFDDKPVETVLETKGMTNVKVISQSGKVVKSIEYGEPIKSVRAVVAGSKECKQEIKFQCKNSILMSYPGNDGRSYGRWVAHDGAYQNYWGGAPVNSQQCGCAVNNQCTNPQKYCNCFEKSSTSRTDEGFLTDKNSLPVSQVQFDDVGPNSDSSFSVESVICTGNGNKDSVVTFMYEDGLISLPPWKPASAGDISLDFKTPYSKGIILDNRGAAGDFFQLKIKDANTMVVIFSLGKPHQQNVEVKLEGKRLDDSQWHSVHLYHNAKEFVLSVDDIENKSTVSPPGYRGLDLHDKLVVGGYLPDVFNGFIGCVRGLIINGDVIDMVKAIEPENKYVKKGCQGACHEKACLNGGQCVDKYNKYTCDCSKTPYTGLFCEAEIKGASFSGDQSYIKYDNFPASFISTDESFILGFTASDCNKMQTLLYVQGSDIQQFYRVRLSSSGQLQLTFYLDQSKDITLDQRNLCDGKRHSLYINRKLQNVTYRVDSEKFETDQITGTLVFNKFKEIIVGNNAAQDNPFKGCLTGVKVKFVGSDNERSVTPINWYFSSGGKKSNQGKGVNEKKCAPDDVPPVTPTPHVPTSLHKKGEGEKDGPDFGARTDDDDDDSVVIIVVVLLLVLLIVLLLVAIVWFMARHKGVYHTHEGDDEGLSMGEQNVALAGAQKGDGKKKEWFI